MECRVTYARIVVVKEVGEEEEEDVRVERARNLHLKQSLVGGVNHAAAAFCSASPSPPPPPPHPSMCV